MSDYAFSDEFSEEFKRHEELDFLDRCAIASMQGMEAANLGCSYEDMAESAYNTSEAMLAERTKRRANRAN